MQNFIVIIFLLAISVSHAQKNYRIEDTIWTYEKPRGFITRSDNFERVIQTGTDHIKKTESKSSNDDVILISIAKSDSSDVNMVLASYKNNINIKKFSLKEYAYKLGEYFKRNPSEENDEQNLSVEVVEQTIDNKLFYVIEREVTLVENNYSYISAYYVTEIDDKEFSIVMVSDNESDRRKIEKSILTSKFK
ncbi:hypothetical protein [uncultured Zobellia sp.]|uniref:hypothetical protein n=1 Tax=uncultured Zobellia sp. TaxID=255433 RepID=UPI00259745C5|nr:hypothetical protein [uncultured Zobellia sp.]